MTGFVCRVAGAVVGMPPKRVGQCDHLATGRTVPHVFQVNHHVWSFAGKFRLGLPSSRTLHRIKRASQVSDESTFSVLPQYRLGQRLSGNESDGFVQPHTFRLGSVRNLHRRAASSQSTNNMTSCSSMSFAIKNFFLFYPLKKNPALWWEVLSTDFIVRSTSTSLPARQLAN